MLRFVLLFVVLCSALTACGQEIAPPPTAPPPTAPPPTAAPPTVDFDWGAVQIEFASAEPVRVRRAIARVVASNPPPVQPLLEGLRSPDRGIREWSAHALGDLAPQDPQVVSALLRAFEDEDDYVRWKAARALGNIGALAKAALPLLVPVADAALEVEVVRASAQKAVAQIRGEPYGRGQR